MHSFPSAIHQLLRWSASLGVAAAVTCSAEGYRFYRAVNLNGPSVTLDGNVWEGMETGAFKATGQKFANQAIVLNPATDNVRAEMLRSSMIGSAVDLIFENVPEGEYLVYLDLWEDNQEERLKLLVNNQVVVTDFASGKDGAWKRLGPWRAESRGGKVVVSSRGGMANLSGVELWLPAKPTEAELAAKAAAEEKQRQVMEKAREWWAFQPLSKPAVPAVKNADWSEQPIDRFILSKLESSGLAPAGLAEKRTLLRRATYDLTGLPPTPQEMAQFLADTSKEAFANVVERLLASPRYGERWGRHWLDVVRYADTAGDNSDFPVPQLHRYRDWVIAAFNADMPYDVFVRQQLAGDLLPKWSAAQVVATGYLANARRFGSRVDDYPTHLTLEDTIDNFGRTFLGLTINCARCHDHKFDPISREDYYALYGIFNSTRYPWPGIELEQRQRDFVPLVPPEKLGEAARQQADYQKTVAELDSNVEKLRNQLEKAPAALKAVLDKAHKEAGNIAAETKSRSKPYEDAYAVAEQPTTGDVAVHIKGNPADLGKMVPRGFPAILGGQKVPPSETGSGRRQLADWVLGKENPLTARVMVNRLWHYHFGKGLVPTPNDFGKHGLLPTHPELLDWLATQFQQQGWSIKAMHRQMMLSKTYQLASERPAEAETKDANNELLASYPRRRLDAESLRDSLLFLSGNLDLSPAGPHPFPPQGEWKFTQHNPFKAIYPTNRRSVYLMTQRIQRHPYLAIFDGPDPSVSTPDRLTSTTPLQALFLLNDAFVHEQAVGFAARVRREATGTPNRLETAYQLALGRPCTPDEALAGEQFLANMQAAAGGDEVKAWEGLARVLFRLNEFAYLD